MRIITAQDTQEEQLQEYPFPSWFHEQIMRDTNNFKKQLDIPKERLDIIKDWAETIKPDLSKHDLRSAWHYAYMWNRWELAKQYKTNDVVMTWPNGYKMVKLPESNYSSRTPKEEHINDIEIEKELMKNMDGVYITTSEQTPYLEGRFTPSSSIVLNTYSLRDEKNLPVATIEIEASKKNPKALTLHNVLGNQQNDTKESNSNRGYIKEFFDYLKKQGYKFTPDENDSYEYGSLESLDENDAINQFGLPIRFYGVGGSEENYYKNLQEAYQVGGDDYNWIERKAKKAVDNLINYAEAIGELNELLTALESGYSTKVIGRDGKEITKWVSFSEDANNMWSQTEMDTDWENPYPSEEPSKEDFMIQPDPNQPVLPGMPPAEPQLDREAYEEAMKEYHDQLKAHEDEVSLASEGFEPFIFQSYAYKKIQEAMKRNPKPVQESPQEPQPKEASMKTMKTKIITADKKIDEKLPSGEQMALYVLTLKQYLDDNKSKISKEWIDLIERLPAPRQIRQDFSFQELKLLYESVEYLWTKVTGHKIIPETEVIKAPESLMGNYIMICNGILLAGLNTNDIIRRNNSLLCSLLNIGGMTMMEKLAGRPNELVKFIIKAGGLRIFITKDKRAYFQCTSDTYGKWARNKIRKLDFKKKVVKVIDLRAEFSGWKSGITVIL